MESLTGYGTPGGWSRDKTLFNLIFYGMLGYKAYANHYQVTGDQSWSVRQGLYAALRWKIWFGTLVVWGAAFFISAFTMVSWWYWPAYWAFAAVVLVTGAVCQGATFVLAIDVGLFKQGFVYRRFYRLAHFLRNVPWAVLHMVALLPWGYVALIYSVESLQAWSLRVPVCGFHGCGNM